MKRAALQYANTGAAGHCTDALPLFTHLHGNGEQPVGEPYNAVDQLNDWKEKPGARHVLKHCYRWAAFYSKDYLRYGCKVSVKLIWEQVRRQIKLGRLRLKTRGAKLSKWGGYTLNNDLTPALARHIMAHRPEWAGMFELRERKEADK